MAFSPGLLFNCMKGRKFQRRETTPRLMLSGFRHSEAYVNSLNRWHRWGIRCRARLCQTSIQSLSKLLMQAWGSQKKVFKFALAAGSSNVYTITTQFLRTHNQKLRVGSGSPKSPKAIACVILLFININCSPLKSTKSRAVVCEHLHQSRLHPNNQPDNSPTGAAAGAGHHRGGQVIHPKTKRNV